MIILGIETSCDETAAAVLEQKNGRIQILSNVVASSATLQTKYGGIIPEQAAREQIKSIIPVIQESLQLSGHSHQNIDAIAVTQGPGLIGSLLVGVETAKTLSLVWDKPLIPVNHLVGHFYANWISLSPSLRAQAKQSNNKIAASTSSPRNDETQRPTFPCIGLLVSGGHTDLVLFKDHGKYEYLGGTRDDAAGECFDKCARLLGLSYPGGPEISKLAQKGDLKKFKLPQPMINSDDYDFSFSGLKTAVMNIVSEELRRTQRFSKSESPIDRNSDKQSLSESFRNDLCAAIEETIVNSLVKKTIKAVREKQIEQIMVAGGVASNQKLKDKLKESITNNLPPTTSLLVPPPYLCTDNAAMIASSAFFEKPIASLLKLQANPSLSLDNS